MRLIPPTTWLALVCIVIINTHNAVAAAIPDARKLTNETVRSGDYEIHYSAFNSTFLSPEVASAYKQPREPRTGIVNVAIRNTKNSQIGKAVTATINGQAKNLLGQITTLTFQEVKEGDAIYYLANFRFNNEDTLNFNLDIRPEQRPPVQQVKFQQQLFEG